MGKPGEGKDLDKGGRECSIGILKEPLERRFITYRLGPCPRGFVKLPWLVPLVDKLSVPPCEQLACGLLESDFTHLKKNPKKWRRELSCW